MNAADVMQHLSEVADAIQADPLIEPTARMEMALVLDDLRRSVASAHGYEEDEDGRFFRFHPGDSDRRDSRSRRGGDF